MTGLLAVTAVLTLLAWWRLYRVPTSYPPAELRRRRARELDDVRRRNYLALRAEERLALSINRPSAVVMIGGLW